MDYGISLYATASRLMTYLDQNADQQISTQPGIDNESTRGNEEYLAAADVDGSGTVTIGELQESLRQFDKYDDEILSFHGEWNGFFLNQHWDESGGFPDAVKAVLGLQPDEDSEWSFRYDLEYFYPYEESYRHGERAEWSEL